MKENYKTSKVSRVEDHYNVLYVRAIFPYILAEVFCYLAVAFEKILASHSLFARCTT